jgi:phosphate starvation-inducible PhoH-like protein
MRFLIWFIFPWFIKMLQKFLHILTPAILLFSRSSNGFYHLGKGLNTGCLYPKRDFSNTPMIMRSKKTSVDTVGGDNGIEIFGFGNPYGYGYSYGNNFGSKNKKFDGRNMSPDYRPRSANQRKYVEFLNNSTVPIILGIGPAGCGKTLFACVTAITGLRNGIYDKIILTRPIVPVEEEELGFLPGTLIKKMDPWTRPIFDIFLEFYSQRDLDAMLNSGVIEISPLAYMRGRTFKRSVIIADEMQNSTPNQMLMLTTRIGDRSKMVITGDVRQSDRPGDKNGLLDFMKKIREHLKVEPDFDVKLVEMENTDIERSPIVSKILELYADGAGSGISNKKTIDNGLMNSMNENMVIGVTDSDYGIINNIIENLDNDKKKDIRNGDLVKDSKREIKKDIRKEDSDAAMIPISQISPKSKIY